MLTVCVYVWVDGINFTEKCGWHVISPPQTLVGRQAIGLQCVHTYLHDVCWFSLYRPNYEGVSDLTSHEKSAAAYPSPEAEMGRADI